MRRKKNNKPKVSHEQAKKLIDMLQKRIKKIDEKIDVLNIKMSKLDLEQVDLEAERSDMWDEVSALAKNLNDTDEPVKISSDEWTYRGHRITKRGSAGFFCSTLFGPRKRKGERTLTAICKKLDRWLSKDALKYPDGAIPLNQVKNWDYHKDVEGHSPCIRCGKPVKLSKSTLWLRSGPYCMETVIPRDAKVDPSGEMGCWPVGSDCLRRFPELKKYAFKMESAKEQTNA